MKNNIVKREKNQLLLDCFLSIKDPRVGGRSRYSLISIVGLVICGVIAGADGWKSIELFGKKRRRWLNQFFDFSQGIPSHYTLARVISLINPEQLQHCFQSWVKQVCQLVNDDIINFDGKTLRGSSHIKEKKAAVHLINAFSARHKITLGEVKTPDKSNEIKGIPLLLNQLDINNKIVTIDAMGTQKGIASLIRHKEAHYVLALKKNHSKFYRRVDAVFKKTEKLNYRGMVYKQWRDKQYAHGRIEEREYTILPLMYLYRYKKEWKDLSLYIRVKSVRHTLKGIETSTRYYISSIPYKKYHKAAQAIRQHWSVENSLHYKLDVGLHEDDCPIYRGFAPQNLATIRKIVLYLLQNENASENGIQLKRLQAALDTRYLRKVIGF